MNSPHGMRFRLGFATVAALLGLGLSVAISGSTAAATPSVTEVACTKYVVTAPSTVDVWIDPHPAGWNELWGKWPHGTVFCAYETNSDGSRIRVDFYCHPAQNCSPRGPWPGWVETNSQFITLLNCTPRTLTRTATVYTVPDWDEAWMTWPSGTSFCDLGTNTAGTRYRVFVYCSLPACHRPEGTYIGWVTTDPLYYTPVPPRTKPPCLPWDRQCTPLPTLSALPE